MDGTTSIIIWTAAAAAGISAAKATERMILDMPFGIGRAVLLLMATIHELMHAAAAMLLGRRIAAFRAGTDGSGAVVVETWSGGWAKIGDGIIGMAPLVGSSGMHAAAFTIIYGKNCLAAIGLMTETDLPHAAIGLLPLFLNPGWTLLCCVSGMLLCACMPSFRDMTHALPLLAAIAAAVSIAYRFIPQQEIPGEYLLAAKGWALLSGMCILCAFLCAATLSAAIIMMSPQRAVKKENDGITPNGKTS